MKSSNSVEMHVKLCRGLITSLNCDAGRDIRTNAVVGKCDRGPEEGGGSDHSQREWSPWKVEMDGKERMWLVVESHYRGFKVSDF